MLQTELERMCLRKVRYPDEPTVRARIGQLYDKDIPNVARLYIYQCKACRGWHMTSAKRGPSQANQTPVTKNNLYADDQRIKRR